MVLGLLLRATTTAVQHGSANTKTSYQLVAKQGDSPPVNAERTEVVGG